MKIDDIYDYNWHDSEIISIRVDEIERGVACVHFDMNHIESYGSTLASRRVLSFMDCYKIKFDLNRGMVVSESIQYLAVLIRSEDLDDLRQKTDCMGGTLPPSLRHYRMETHSGSMLNILAASVYLTEASA